MTIRRCPQCGATTDDVYGFCIKCGYEFPKIPEKKPVRYAVSRILMKRITVSNAAPHCYLKVNLKETTAH